MSNEFLPIRHDHQLPTFRSRLRLLTIFHAGVALMLLSLIATAQTTQSFNNSTAPGANLNRLERKKDFHRQRAFPYDKVPVGARLGALDQLNKMFAQEATATASAQANSWIQIGARPVNSPWWGINSGRVLALAVDPTSSSSVYLGAAGGGVWKTTDGGTNWSPLTDIQVSNAIGAIAIAPSNPNIIYAGTGEDDDNIDAYAGAGILHSTNGGHTWKNSIGPFSGARIGSLAVHPTSSSTLLAAATPGGVYRSTNSGSSWTQVLKGIEGTKVKYDLTGSIAYAAMGYLFGESGAGLYKSIDGGKNWTNVFTAPNMGRVMFGFAPSNPDTIYVAAQNTATSGLLGMWKSTNGGAAWVQLSTAPGNLCDSQCWYDLALEVNPSNSDYVVAGGADSGTLFATKDGGTTWANVTLGSNGVVLHPDLHALAFDKTGTTLYVGNDGGVWSTTSTDSLSVPWTNLNSTLAITQYYPGLSIDPTNPNHAIAGTQDNSTEHYTGSLQWDSVVCGDGGMTAIDSFTPTTLYAACTGISINKSTSLNNWSAATNGINAADRAQWIAPLAIDTQLPTVLYFGTYRVYQTVDGAASWKVISSDLTGGADLSAIAVAPSNSDTVYAGSGDGHLNVTINAGAGVNATWADRTTGLPARYISSIAVGPRNPSLVYLTLSGFGSGHVFVSKNAGTTWTNITGNLPNIPANEIVVDPLLPNTLYVATDIGVFQTRNGGTKWTTLVSGLPRVPVLSLKLNNAARVLRAATHGRSMFDIQLPKR